MDALQSHTLKDVVLKKFGDESYFSFSLSVSVVMEEKFLVSIQYKPEIHHSLAFGENYK